MNIALLLSGGVGTRLGSEIPKQYIDAGGRPILSYSLEQLFMHPGISAVQIVADKAWFDKIREWLSQYDRNMKFRGFSEPGINRQLSILNGLKNIREYASDRDYVLIHDAARPQLSERLITDCLEAVKGHDGVLPVLHMKDTIYKSVDGKQVCSLLKREELYSGQAPEVFVLGKYLEANRRLMPDEMIRINGSTEPAIMAGMDITMIPGDEKNYKITTMADLELFYREIS